MPHVIRNYDPESTLVMDSKGLFDALDYDLPKMTEIQPWRYRSLNNLCVVQTVDLVGAPQSECSRRCDSSTEHTRSHCSICYELECTR